MRAPRTGQAGRVKGAVMPLLAAGAALLAFAAAGCGLTDPYVFKADEFNRESPTFNKPLQDGQPVSICYNGFGTTDLELQRLADRECTRFGKRAQQVDNNCQSLPPSGSAGGGLRLCSRRLGDKATVPLGGPGGRHRDCYRLQQTAAQPAEHGRIMHGAAGASGSGR